MSKLPILFDHFEDIKCEDEMARLDSLALQLQHEPSSWAAVIFYGGRLFRGRLPQRGEPAARAMRLKTYLVNRRGIPANQIQMIDGGYDNRWRVEMLIVPPGAVLPTVTSPISIEGIRFRKGKANPSKFQCKI